MIAEAKEVTLFAGTAAADAANKNSVKGHWSTMTPGGRGNVRLGLVQLTKKEKKLCATSSLAVYEIPVLDADRADSAFLFTLLPNASCRR